MPCRPLCKPLDSLAFGFLHPPEVWQEHWSADKHLEEKKYLISMLQPCMHTQVPKQKCSIMDIFC
eukprot:1138005-Pelagomonas_calceolata.AAC.3